MKIRKGIVHTILVVHFLNLKQVFPLVDNIVVQFVPACYRGKLGTWEFCYGREEEAVGDEAENIERADTKDGDGSTQTSIFRQISLHLR